MVGINGNRRDGGGRREDIPLTYSPSFHFFYFSLFLSPSFFLASFFLFFCNYIFFQRYIKISKEFTGNKDMEELFDGGLKRVCQNLKCNV